MTTRLFNVILTKHTMDKTESITDNMIAKNHYEVATEMERRHSGENRNQRISNMIITEADDGNNVYPWKI